MVEDNLWVIGCNKQTGEREQMTCCPKGQVAFYEELYKMNGCDVGIFTMQEIDELIEREGLYPATCGEIM